LREINFNKFHERSEYISINFNFNMGKKIIQKILKILARRVIKKYQPIVIGITGSVGKSSTKEAIYEILKNNFRARKSQGNYNNEIGLPLTILGFPSAGKNIFGWLKIFIKVIFNLLPEKENYPEILILEMAADHPGDIAYLLKIVKPQIGVLTSVSPSHLEFFKEVENVFAEKQLLIKNLPLNGWAILNKDDKLIASLENKIKSKILTFGLGEEAMVRGIEIFLSQSLEEKEIELKGLQFKIKYQGNVVPIFLSGVISCSQVYAILAAVAVGLSLNLNLLTIANYLSSYKHLPSRMSVLKGKKEVVIIDDTYNSSPMAVKEALKTLLQIKLASGARKWIVLADMLELGKKSIDLHYEVGEEVAKGNFNFLLTYGKESIEIAKGAREKGMNEKNIFSFDKQDQLIKFLEENILTGDIILVKGSRGMRMENVVKALI